jgi:hypothetical protein
MNSKKKGRPKGARALEKERIERLFQDPPPYLKKMTSPESAAFAERCKDVDRVESEILDQYRISPTTPKQHAFEMASLGDESLEGHEDEILARDEAYISRANVSRQAGATERSNTARANALALGHKNKAVIARVRSGELSINSAAHHIHRKWHETGIVGLDRPSIRTISRYLILAIRNKT